MPMSAMMSALRAAGRQHLTASTVAGRQVVTGSHVFRIQGYTQLMRKTVPTGTAVTSTTFRFGGRPWQIECYPNGKDEEHRGYTSLFVTNPGLDATARFGLTVLAPAGRPTSCARASDGDVYFHLFNSGVGWKDFVKNDELDEGEHLVDDCLTVLCDVTIDQGMRADEVPAEVASRGLFAADAIWSKKPRDVVTVHAGGETFSAARSVLDRTSPVFKADLQNATSGELHIDDDVDAEVFKAMLQFMQRDAHVLPRSDEQIKVEATVAERLLVTADKYGLEKLKVAYSRAGETLCTGVDMGSVGAMLALAERHGCPVLNEACMRFLSSAGNLRSFMATDGFERLKKDCPSAAVEIVEIVVKQLP